jgi:hypothetical protein
LTLIGLVIGLAAATASCAPAATDAELGAMCENLVALRGEIDTETLEERTAAVEEDFAKREKLHHEQQEAALRGVDGALKGKLEDLKNDEEAKDDEEAKKKIEADHAENRKKLEQQGAELLAQLKAQKDEALADAKQKAEKAQADHAAAVKKCVDESKAEGVTQALAQCRTKAESTDAYWNQCR